MKPYLFFCQGDGSSQKIIDDELELMSRIAAKYPSLADKPFYNE